MQKRMKHITRKYYENKNVIQFQVRRGTFSIWWDHIIYITCSAFFKLIFFPTYLCTFRLSV